MVDRKRDSIETCRLLQDPLHYSYLLQNFQWRTHLLHILLRQSHHQWSTPFHGREVRLTCPKLSHEEQNKEAVEGTDTVDKKKRMRMRMRRMMLRELAGVGNLWEASLGR